MKKQLVPDRVLPRLIILSSIPTAHERFVLAQKYGYELPEITDDILLESKDPRQVFFGLHPGWLINLADKEIYKPNDKELLDYYNS